MERQSKKRKKSKKEKKAKKSRKKHKADKSSTDDVGEREPHGSRDEQDDGAPVEQPSASPSSNASAATAQQPVDVRSFFERIKAQEAGKETVGTVHASGFRAPNPTSLVASEQWECVKRGCGQKNNKKAAACSKCGAMKRLSEWR